MKKPLRLMVPTALPSRLILRSTGLIALTVVLLSWHWALAQPITSDPIDTSVSLGATAQFTVSATPTIPPMTFQWWFKDSPLDANANPSAATTRLSLTNVTLAQGGPYFVVVSDLSGVATSQVATLTVDPTFTKITQGSLVNDHLQSRCGRWGDYDNDGRLDVLVTGPANKRGSPTSVWATPRRWTCSASNGRRALCRR